MFRKRIPLYYSSEKIQRKRDFENFGDVLSGEIVSFVSGKPIQWASPNSKWYEKPILFAVGSIIRKTRGKCYVWGSGIKYSNDKIHPKSIIFAVRGKYTLDAVKKAGCQFSNTNFIPLGDPGLLAPLLWKEKVEVKYSLGIVPHFIHFKKWKDVKLPENIKLIDVTKSPQEVIAEIRSCKKIISSSLHGLVISHAYNIPGMWVKFSDEESVIGSDIKYLDYFSSVGIEPYKPNQIINPTVEAIDVLMAGFEMRKGFTLISYDLKRIQDDLIAAFPKELKSKSAKI